MPLRSAGFSSLFVPKMTQNGDKGKGCWGRGRTGDGVLALYTVGSDMSSVPLSTGSPLSTPAPKCPTCPKRPWLTFEMPGFSEPFNVATG